MEISSKGYWVEIRPLITSELKTGNFAPILDALYNLAKPYRFLIKNTPKNREEKEPSLIRFYIQLFDEQTKNQMSNIIRTLLDVETVSAEPPEQAYQFRVELELAKNYALPIVNYQEKKPTNLIDRLTASITGLDTSIEITAQADPNAILNIQTYIHKKSNSHYYANSSLSKEVLNQSIDTIGILAGKNTTPKPTKNTSATYNADPWGRECAKNATIKLASTLFICQIVIQSNSTQTAQAIKKALPAAMNHFKTAKTQKNPQPPLTTLRPPPKYWLRNNIFCRLWWIVSIGILLLTYQLGLFDPIKFMTAPLSKMDVGPPLLAAIVAVCLFINFRKRHPIVLSTQELAQIIGLPTAIEKLPIALGKVPLSRMQLGTQPPTEQPKQPLNKQETPNQKNSLPTNQHRRLPAAHENKGPPATKTEQN